MNTRSLYVSYGVFYFILAQYTVYGERCSVAVVVILLSAFSLFAYSYSSVLSPTAITRSVYSLLVSKRLTVYCQIRIEYTLV